MKKQEKIKPYKPRTDKTMRAILILIIATVIVGALSLGFSLTCSKPPKECPPCSCFCQGEEGGHTL